MQSLQQSSSAAFNDWPPKHWCALQRWKFCKKIARFHLLQSCLSCQEIFFFIVLKNAVTNSFLTLRTGLLEWRQHFSPFSKERKKKTKKDTKIQQLPFIW